MYTCKFSTSMTTTTTQPNIHNNTHFAEYDNHGNDKYEAEFLPTPETARIDKVLCYCYH